jgi:hypothetical protein
MVIPAAKLRVPYTDHRHNELQGSLLCTPAGDLGRLATLLRPGIGTCEARAADSSF